MTLFIIIVVICVFSLLVVLLKKHKNKAINEIQKKGLSTIFELMNLISHIQKHRGLNAAWIGGDKKVQAQLTALKSQVSQDTKKISVDSVSEDERWLAFCDHWRRLLKLNDELTISNSFEQHTKMIRNLIYLIEDVAESTYLTSDHIPDLPHIGFIWRELPAAIETIGQSRAIGTGVAAKSFCSSVNKIQLSFLSESMTNITDKIFKQLSYLPHEKEQHEKLVITTTEKMNELNEIIADKLINAALISVDSIEYFEIATSTMQQASDIFYHQTQQIEQLLA